MGIVINLDEKRFVKEFVDAYTQNGPEAAGYVAINYGVDWFDEENPKVRALSDAVRQEFIDRGWELVEDGSDE